MSDTARFILKDVSTPYNSATAGTLATNYVLGAVTTYGSTSTLGSVIPRFYTICGLYRQFMINKLVIKWIPNQAFTTSGSVALGIDTSPVAGVPGNLGQVIHHNPSFLIDLKTANQMTFIPRKKDPRYTALVAGIDEDELSFGQLQVYSTNGLAASVPVGLIWFELDVTLIGPT